MVVLETAEFVVQRMAPGDEATMLALFTDPHVVRFVDDGSVLSSAQVDAWIVKSAENYARHGYGTWLLAEREGGPVFGWGGFVSPGREPVPELIYGLARSHWGRGLGKAVAAALTGHGITRLGFHQILATIDDANLGSCRILERLGFRLEGVVEDELGRVRRYLLDRDD